MSIVQKCGVTCCFPGCDDVLVVIGGFGHQQSPIDTVEKFDPKTQRWMQLPVSLGLITLSVVTSTAFHEDSL